MTPRPRPPETPRPDDAALLRYVSGESTLAETQAIEEWLAADADLEASVREVRASWMTAAPTAPAWDKEDVWRRIDRETRAPRHSRPVPFRMERRTRTWALPMGIAAAAALAFIAVRYGMSSLPSAAEAPVIFREVVTARAQQAVMDLPDGSRVTLGPESKLRIPSNFDVAGTLGRRRELQLIGQAYFVVTHDSTRPFVVHTATATTQDIGTAFVINAYPDRPATQVVVTDGVVALRELCEAQPMAGTSVATAPREPGCYERPPLMTLTRGDAATLDSSGTATLTRNVNLDRFTSWTKGILTLDGVRLRDAIPEMERWYDVDIRLTDRALGERRITAQLRSEPASSASERLALVLDANVRLDGRVITVAPRDSERRR